MLRMEAMLCSLCVGLDIDGAMRRLENRHDTEACGSVQVGSEWHLTLAAVDESSESCDLCRVIMKGWQRSREVVVEEAIREAMFDPQTPPPDLHDPVFEIRQYRTESEITLELVKQPRVVYDGRKNASSLFLRVQCSPATAITSFDALDPVTAELRVVHSGSNHSLDSSLPPRRTDALISPDPLSQQSLDIARGWLDTCVSTHGPACNANPEGWMPTRVLEILVPDGNRICLRKAQALPADDDRRYVALSHCWGQDGTPFTSTRGTLPLRMEGIDVTTLPKTFRDAVALVQRLGLRYLWIDSLCIVQDDSDDWARESAQMANVYRRAHLVLNAANSPGDTAGFLSERVVLDTVLLPPPPLPTTGLGSSEQQLGLQLRSPPGKRWHDPSGPDNLAGEPVTARAWCLQERYLPTRALQYGTYQAFWECESMRASEVGDAVAQEIEGGRGGRLTRLCRTGNGAAGSGSVFARQRRDPRYEGGSDSEDVAWIGWYKIIEDYTARQITKATDRLPALSGLARAVASKTQPGNHYLAGLWRFGLLEGLLWCKARPGSQALVQPGLLYVAPSWSWASVAGPVQFPIYTWYTKRARWKAKMADFEPLAEYLGHSTQRLDADPYGRLGLSRLLLRAPVLPVESIRTPRPRTAPGLESLFGQEPARSEVADVVVQMRTGSGSIWIEGGFDRPNQSAAIKTKKLSVVLLTRLPHVLEHGFIEHRFGLILKRVETGSNKYRRVGFVDGVVLEKKSTLAAMMLGREPFSIVGYPRPHEAGDIDGEGRDNDLARDPLKLEKTKITII